MVELVNISHKRKVSIKGKMARRVLRNGKYEDKLRERQIFWSSEAYVWGPLNGKECP